MPTEITASLFEEVSQPFASYPVFDASADGFDVQITVEEGDGSALHWYGRWCEDHNAPARAHLVRNPRAWVKRDTGNGTDSWVRTSSRVYGWFAWELFDPAAEVEAHIRNGKDEREAWAIVNGDIRRTVEGLADGDIHEVYVTVTVSRSGIELASESCGTEIDDRDPRADRHAQILDVGMDLTVQAIHDAKAALASLCACH